MVMISDLLYQLAGSAMAERELADELRTDLPTVQQCLARLGALDIVHGPNGAERLWTAVRDRPDATSTQAAVDNWIIALCQTTQRNLVWLFEDVWRWPVSDRAKRAVQQLPSGF